MILENTRTGSCIAFGTATRDAERTTFGDKNTEKVKFAIAVNAFNAESEYLNCEAVSCATLDIASKINKGDTVEVLGFTRTHEYNDKTYKTLNCQRIKHYPKQAYVQDRAAQTAQAAPADDFTDLDSADLPF